MTTPGRVVIYIRSVTKVISAQLQLAPNRCAPASSLDIDTKLFYCWASVTDLNLSRADTSYCLIDLFWKSESIWLIMSRLHENKKIVKNISSRKSTAFIKISKRADNYLYASSSYAEFVLVSPPPDLYAHFELNFLSTPASSHSSILNTWYSKQCWTDF